MDTQEFAMPDGLLWGAATASYQIEGAVREDGRGESIWDRFSHTPGKVKHGDTGDVACDHYHRVAEDIGIMRELGLHAYRFSIAWPRILPAGTGERNAAGLDFYDRLVDDLLAAGITPFVTLYHWDLPQALQDRGGWSNRESVSWFRTYVDAVSRRLGDRVLNWITHNEPWVVAVVGNLMGRHAPGLTDLATTVRVAHHLLLSHGEAVPALRANSKPEARVGITLNLNHVDPASDSEADRAAAAREDRFLNRWFLDPIFRAAYPPELLAFFASQGVTPPVEQGDLERIAVPIDFLGVNNYFRSVMQAGPSGDGTDDRHIKPESSSYTAMDWEIWPDGLRRLLVRLQRDYAPPALYITENGAAFDDTLTPDGQVHDAPRVVYLRDHLRACRQAILEGAALRGYFVWSLLDNFEWAEGYAKRFGITYVDYPTQRRVIKDSGRYYARVIRANGPVD
jgi:beta-glucosidase